MSDTQAIINAVNAGWQQASKKNPAVKIYRDEPIIMRASQMPSYTPAMYAKMRRIAVECYAKTESEVFYRQAKFMENFEDDCCYKGEFKRYYPTFRSMNDAQLRGYFTWRSKVRKGLIEKTSLSYVYVYLYELLNGVGQGTPQELFLHLLHFWNEYEKLDDRIAVYKNRWLKDFCIYYNLPVCFYAKVSEDTQENKNAALIHCAEESDQAVFEALESISSYKIRNSAFFKTHTEECIAVTASVVRALAVYDKAKNPQQDSCCFGAFCSGKRMLFSGAVFFDRLKHEEYEYRINESEVYTCNNGQWRYAQFMCYTGRNQPAGAVLRTIDSKLREKTGYKSKIKAGELSVDREKIIEQCIDDYFISRRFRAAESIEIDLSLLSAIRSDALETQGRLLTEEEQEPVRVVEIKQPENCTQLSDLQFAFLLRLIKNESYDDLLQQSGQFVNLLADEINEVLYEEFGDTVIDFNGNLPFIIEDYADDLKGYIGL
ncbi:MAG: TerB N-terminal domain-containing protein [Clostridia bacterium]|nr:TerB N-terminal domain-containing protein [Clostridia bacterium]